MEYSLDCLRSLDPKSTATPLYGKTKYVSLYAVVGLDLFKHYLGDQVSASEASGPLVKIKVEFLIHCF